MQEFTIDLRFNAQTMARFVGASAVVARFAQATARAEQAMLRARLAAMSEAAGDGCPCMWCREEREQAGVPADSAPNAPTDEDAKASLWAILERPEEAHAVQRALREGTFEGLSSERCLVGIVAGCRGMDYNQLLVRLGRTPIESWVMTYVHAGMTPKSNKRAAQLDAWLAEWLEEHQLELPAARIVAQAADAAGTWELTPADRRARLEGLLYYPEGLILRE